MPAKQVLRSRRFIRWTILIIVAVVALLAAGLGLYMRHVTPLLSQRLRDQVLRSSDSLYHVEFSRLQISPFSGEITLSSFRLTPDTAVYDRMKEMGVAPENIVDLYVPELKLAHAHPLRLLFLRKVQINDVKIEYPVVRIRHENLFLSEKNQSIQKTLANLISGPLKAIHIDRLDLDNVNLSYKNMSNPGGKGFALEKADVIFRDLAIDAESVADTNRLLYARDCWIHLVHFEMPTPDSLYQIGMQDLVYDVRDEKMLVQGLALKPRYDEPSFDKLIGHQKDRYDLRVDSLTVRGLGLLDILRRKTIGRINTVSLHGVKADIYHNRKLPPAPGRKSLLQPALRKAAEGTIFKTIRATFTIDTLYLRGADVVYRERSQQTDRIGEVDFNQMNATFQNITDDSLALAGNHRMRGDVNTLFMGKSEARAHFVFNLTDPACAFSYSGSLAPMKASVLNKATRYLGLLKIRSGNIHSLRFNFSANTTRSTGTVRLLYDELSISILSVDEISGRLKKKALASLMANLLVLRNNNVTDSAAVQKAAVTYPYDPEKSIFNYMWKSIFQGVKVVVGMDQDASQLKKDLQQNKLVQKIREKKTERKAK